MTLLTGQRNLSRRGAASAALVTPGQLRDLMCQFPTGVAIITTTDSAARPRGMTCTSLASICLQPPTLMVSIHTGSDTLCALLARGRFAINILHQHAEPTAQRFAADIPDRFAGITWQPTESGMPWLTDDALAFAECQPASLIEAGDHTAVFATVSHSTATSGSPLLYGQRRYSALPR